MSDQTAGHGLKGSQINIFSTECKNKNDFLIDNEDLTQLRHLIILFISSKNLHILQLDWPADSNASLGGPVDQLSLKKH